MGFFSDLFDMTPNRTVAHQIQEYCSRVSLNNKESELIKNSNINEQQYIWLRNTYNYCVFRGFIKVFSDQRPNTYWSITQSYLDRISHETFYSSWRVALFKDLNVPLPTTYGLWEHYFDDFCSHIEDKLNAKLPSHVKDQLMVLASNHQNDIVEIVKSKERKLNELL